mgnify:CR=1 FL=1
MKEIKIPLHLIYIEALIAAFKTAKTFKIQDLDKFIKIYQQNFFRGMKQYNEN